MTKLRQIPQWRCVIKPLMSYRGGQRSWRGCQVRDVPALSARRQSNEGGRLKSQQSVHHNLRCIVGMLNLNLKKSETYNVQYLPLCYS